MPDASIFVLGGQNGSDDLLGSLLAELSGVAAISGGQDNGVVEILLGDPEQVVNQPLSAHIAALRPSPLRNRWYSQCRSPRETR
jgi:hypothetical protein